MHCHQSRAASGCQGRSAGALRLTCKRCTATGAGQQQGMGEQCTGRGRSGGGLCLASRAVALSRAGLPGVVRHGRSEAGQQGCCREAAGGLLLDMDQLEHNRGSTGRSAGQLQDLSGSGGPTSDLVNVSCMRAKAVHPTSSYSVQHLRMMLDEADLPGPHHMALYLLGNIPITADSLAGPSFTAEGTPNITSSNVSHKGNCCSAGDPAQCHPVPPRCCRSFWLRTSDGTTATCCSASGGAPAAPLAALQCSTVGGLCMLAGPCSWEGLPDVCPSPAHHKHHQLKLLLVSLRVTASAQTCGWTSSRNP